MAVDTLAKSVSSPGRNLPQIRTRIQLNKRKQKLFEGQSGVCGGESLTDVFQTLTDMMFLTRPEIFSVDLDRSLTSGPPTASNRNAQMPGGCSAAQAPGAGARTRGHAGSLSLEDRRTEDCRSGTARPLCRCLHTALQLPAVSALDTGCDLGHYLQGDEGCPIRTFPGWIGPGPTAGGLC